MFLPLVPAPDGAPSGVRVGRSDGAIVEGAWVGLKFLEAGVAVLLHLVESNSWQ